jgi:hypothetical protein
MSSALVAAVVVVAAVVAVLFFDLFSIYGTSGHRQLTSEPDR